jgi:hypothetical protein
MKHLIKAVILILLIACDDGRLSTGENNGDGLNGKWLLFERGYSPGLGYIVDPVDPQPPQTLNFLANRKVSSTIQELKEFSHYRIFDDAHQGGKIVAFYSNDPGETATVESSAAAYNVTQGDDQTLRLDFRFCFEGCHIALRKLE